MKTETQQLIVIILGVLAVASILKGYEQVLLTIVGILGGFITAKNMTEKQEETLEKYYVQKAEEPAQIRKEVEDDVQ